MPVAGVNPSYHRNIGNRIANGLHSFFEHGLRVLLWHPAGQPDEHGLALDVVHGHEAPLAAVGAVVAVVAHDHQVVLGDHILPIGIGAVRRKLDEVMHIAQEFIHIGDFVLPFACRSMNYFFSVDIDILSIGAYFVPGQTNHPFNEVFALIFWKQEYHDVAALGIRELEKPFLGKWDAQAIDELVHKEMVADQEARHHGGRRYLEGLEYKRAYEQRNEYR